MHSLSGKIALVTGGGTGVGAQIADSLAQAGVAVVVSGRNREHLQTTVERSPSIESIVCDVTDRQSVDHCCDHIAQQFGGLDIVVANAGVAVSAAFTDTSAAQIRSQFEVNLLGVFNTWQAALPLVSAAENGRLIAIASTAGLTGYPYVSGYCASKHAVVGLTKSLAAELAKTKVTVNSICPGYVNTAMLDRTLQNIVAKTGCSTEDAEQALKKINPQGRFIEPIEIASMVLWLASENSKSITGQALSVCGGEL